MNNLHIENAVSALDADILDSILRKRHQRMTESAIHSIRLYKQVACAAAAILVICSCAAGSAAVLLNRPAYPGIPDSTTQSSDTPPSYVPNFSTPSMEELYATEPYSRLLPRTIFSGLAFRSSYLTLDDPFIGAFGPHYLHLSFSSADAKSKLEIKVSPRTGKEQLADPHDPSTYDLSLYYGPIENEGALGGKLPTISGLFLPENISEEIAAARIYTFRDGLCKAEIALLCEEYVVSYGYNGSAISGEALYRMIISSDWFSSADAG